MKYVSVIALLSFLKESLTSAKEKVDVLMVELDMSVDDSITDSTLSKA